MATLDGYAIIGPVSPWDEPHRAAIELDHARQTFSDTAAGAWRLQCRINHSNDPGELSRRTQHWHDRGYRLRKATLTLHPAAQED